MLATLYRQVAECGDARAALQDELAALRDRVDRLNRESAELQAATKATGCLSLVVFALVTAGGSLVVAAGALPNLPDALKAALGYGGSGVIACGLVVDAAAWRLTPRVGQ